MGVYDILSLPGTEADGEQIKCWYNDMRSIRVGDKVRPIVQTEEPDEESHRPIAMYPIRDYVLVLRCGGMLVVRDCKLQGYYREAELVPGDPPVQELPVFDKWGEPWVNSQVNCGILGEPYFYRDSDIGRAVEGLAGAG